MSASLVSIRVEGVRHSGVRSSKGCDVAAPVRRAVVENPETWTQSGYRPPPPPSRRLPPSRRCFSRRGRTRVRRGPSCSNRSRGSSAPSSTPWMPTSGAWTTSWRASRERSAGSTKGSASSTKRSAGSTKRSNSSVETLRSSARTSRSARAAGRTGSGVVVARQSVPAARLGPQSILTESGPWNGAASGGGEPSRQIPLATPPSRQQRPQPALGLGHRHPLAAGVVLQLVGADAPH